MTKQTERIRTTISVDKEVHQIFVAMAEAGGMSVSRCMGEWLADTAEGAQFVAQKMKEAKAAPKTVMRELQAAAMGMHEMATEVLDDMRIRKTPPPARASARRAEVISGSKAPSSNTGLNSPKSPNK
jgi:hypothetical protein